MTLFRGKEGLLAFGDHDLAERQADILKEFQRRHPGADDISLTGGLTQTASVAVQETRSTPERVKVYPEISLDEELIRQTRIIIERVAIPLGISSQDAILPSSFPERPEFFNDENSVPVIVPKFLFPWGRVVDAASLEMSDYLRGRLSELGTWKDPRGIVTPDKSYGAWLYVGNDYLYRKPSDVRSEIPQGLRAGDHWDGLGLAVVREDIVRAKWFDLIGGGVGRGGMPCVRWWDDRPRFVCFSDQDAAPGFRSLVAGSQFKVK